MPGATLASHLAVWPLRSLSTCRYDDLKKRFVLVDSNTRSKTARPATEEYPGVNRHVTHQKEEFNMTAAKLKAGRGVRKQSRQDSTEPLDGLSTEQREKTAKGKPVVRGERETRDDVMKMRLELVTAWKRVREAAKPNMQGVRGPGQISR